MKKVLLSFLLIGGLSLIGCEKNPDAIKYVENNTPQTQTQIDWWSQAEEYNPAKEYADGDVVYYEGEVSKIWDASSTNYWIGGANWYESKDFSMEKDILPWGGKVKVVGEAYGAKSFWIKDFEIVEVYGITLEDYIIERARMDTNGISKEEAEQLKKWCNENEDCKFFEEALDPSIYDLYPELNN